ncbi:hypothetical protein KTO58_01305 [Chitinophaga pendula]|uniref:hypothetical protein n=1 Tax=Chitinophaga TaxID=79328 RepID=UPI0012FDD9CD|nr:MULTISPECIES: hypothetical protein [Chitinophaga]UCJ07843.1 hypothetical protein KTO58_01305 [Chitinophaga pendula]
MDEFLFKSSIVLWYLFNAALLAAIIWAIFKFYKLLTGLRKNIVELIDLLRHKKD